MRRNKIGFTLVELLVVMAIISILAAMLLPALSRARQQARAVACRSNMKQVGYSAGMYQTDFNELFPTSNNTAFPLDPNGWGCAFWCEDEEEIDCAIHPLLVFAHFGYLKLGWTDNRDRLAGTVTQCPADRAASHIITDMHDFNACQYAHSAAGLTCSYTMNQQLSANYNPGMREWARKMTRPSGTAYMCEYTWWNLSGGGGFQGMFRVKGWASLDTNNNTPASLDRHGSDSANVLYADLHVANMYAFAWNHSKAFCRYKDDGDAHKSCSEPAYFHLPLGYYN